MTVSKQLVHMAPKKKKKKKEKENGPSMNKKAA